MLLRRLRAEERAFQVSVDDKVPVVIRHLEQQVVADDPRARDQGVEPAEFLNSSLHHRLDLPAVAHIARDGEPADGARNLTCRRLVQVRHRDPGALGGKQRRRRGPDAAAATGDQRHLVLEPHWVSVSSAVPPSFRGSEAPCMNPSFSRTMTWGREKYES